MTVIAYVPRVDSKFYDRDEEVLKMPRAKYDIEEMLQNITPDNVHTDQWDEKLRGPKMSDNGGKVIYKYQMPVLEEFTMKLPLGAEIIRMDNQDGMFWLWAVVDTRLVNETRKFHAVKCGGNVPENKNLVYRGFCKIFVQQELGLYIFEDIGYAN